MLNKIKKFVIRQKWIYHDNIADYAYKKINTCKPEDVDYWCGVFSKHLHLSFNLVEELLAMEGI